MRAKEIRARARMSLKGRWGVAIATTLVAGILGVFGAPTISFKFDIEEILEQVNLEYIFAAPIGKFILGLIGTVLAVATTWSIVRFLIGGALKLGYSKFAVNMADGREAKFGDLFSRFDDFGKGLVMQLLMDIFTFLWALLFIIPGIIKVFAYSMTPFIINDHPELSANQAIKASKMLMKGNKWRLFCLELSFIGWALLCCLTFGIGNLWLNPYIQISKAEFYRQICAEKNMM